MFKFIMEYKQAKKAVVNASLIKTEIEDKQKVFPDLYDSTRRDEFKDLHDCLKSGEKGITTVYQNMDDFLHDGADAFEDFRKTLKPEERELKMSKRYFSLECLKDRVQSWKLLSDKKRHKIDLSLQTLMHVEKEKLTKAHNNMLWAKFEARKGE